MSDFASIKTAWKAAVQVAVGTNVPVVWAADPRGLELKLPFRIELDGPHSLHIPGQKDTVEFDDDGLPTVLARREARLTIRANSRSNPGNSQAEFVLERIRVRIRLPEIQDALNAAGIALYTFSDTVSYATPPYPSNSEVNLRWESISAFEILFGMQLTFDEATGESVGIIESTEITQDSGPGHVHTYVVE